MTAEVAKAEGEKPPRKPRAPAYLTVTEDSMKRALIEARGDIFVASQLLGITAIRLDRAIAISEVLKAARLEAKAHQANDAISEAEISQAVDRRVALYRVAGLDALHDLATMPIDENSAQNQVKLAAAARLAGPADNQSGSGDFASILRELNDSYQENAPRLRVTRERLTVETVPAERIVGQAGQPSGTDTPS